MQCKYWWAVVVVVLLGGCLGEESEPQEVPQYAPPVSEIVDGAIPTDDGGPWVGPTLLVTDPVGDATEQNSGRASQVALQACNLAPFGERETCQNEIPQDEYGGIPARSAFDLTGVEMVESPNVITVIVHLRELDIGIEQFLDATGAQNARIGIEFNAGEECYGTVQLLARALQGNQVGNANLWRTNDICNPDPDDLTQGVCSSGNWCAFPIEYKVVPGQPGAIVLTIPRAELRWDEPDLVISAHAVVIQETSDARPGGWLMPGTDLGTGQFSYDQRLDSYVVDRTAEVDFQLQLPGNASALVQLQNSTEATHTQPLEPPEIDVINFRFSDDPINFTYHITVRELPENPSNVDFIWQLNTPGDEHIVTLGTGDGGQWNASSWRVLADRQIPVTTVVKATPGAPGLVEITMPRSELPGTAQGSLTKGFWGSLYQATSHQEPDSPAGFIYSDNIINHGFFKVYHPYQFQTAAGAQNQSISIAAGDALGDAVLPDDVILEPGFRSSQLDLTFIDLKGTKDRGALASIGIAGLTEFEVPRSYDAVTYGVGMQAVDGPVMIGIRIDADGVHGFCGPDTSFLTPDPRDPEAGPSLEIPFSFVPATASAPAILSLEAPAKCLGTGGDQNDFTVQKFGARSALIRTAAGTTAQYTFWIADEAVNLEGGQLSFPQEAMVAPSFWAQPFGVENFWDITGVVIAIMFAAISAIIIVRKRVRMKRYLIRLEELGDEHHEFPEKYASELVKLRRKLFHDMLSNRLTEGHFVMVEERLRGSLAATRINAFGRAFYHLPPALMIRLQSLLADGRFSAQDHRVIAELLGELDIPEQSRMDVRKQIAGWAAQDQGVAALAKQARRRKMGGLLRKRKATAA